MAKHCIGCGIPLGVNRTDEHVINDLVGRRNEIGHGAVIAPPPNAEFVELWKYPKNWSNCTATLSSAGLPAIPDSELRSASCISSDFPPPAPISIPRTPLLKLSNSAFSIPSHSIRMLTRK